MFYSKTPRVKSATEEKMLQKTTKTLKKPSYILGPAMEGLQQLGKESGHTHFDEGLERLRRFLIGKFKTELLLDLGGPGEREKK